MVPHRFSGELWHNEAPSIFSTDGFMDCMIVSLAGWEKSTIGSPYCFKYYLSNRVFDMGCAPVSVAKADSSSPELVRDTTSFSVSLVEMLTTLLEDALVLPLNFLFVKSFTYWLWTMSGWTHIISPRGIGTKTRPFSFWLWGPTLITLDSPFGMGITPVGAGGRSQPNWRGDVAVILSLTFFCSRWGLSTSASIRAWRTPLKM